MENLNAEQIKKALEWGISEEFCENCLCTVYGKSMTSFLNEALAIINSQEQRIKELTEELTRKETEYNELYELLQTYKADSEAYRSYSKTLEKENEMLLNIKNLNLDKVIADTVRKMQEMVYEFADDLNTIDAYIIKEMIDEIAKEMLEGEE